MKLVCGHPEIFKGFRNSYGMFHNVENFIMMMGNSRDVYMQEKLGYFGERLILEAVERNMGTCWVGGTFAKDALKPYVKEDEKLYCVIAIGYTAHKKTLKEQLISHATAQRKNRGGNVRYHSAQSGLDEKRNGGSAAGTLSTF